MNAISVTPVILPHQKKNSGLYPVKIRVTYKRKSKYIATSISASRSDLTPTLDPKSPELKKKVFNKFKEVQDIVDSIPLETIYNSDVDDVIRYIEKTLEMGKEFRLDFIQYGREISEDMCKSSRGCYLSALNALERFKAHIDISEVTGRLLYEFEIFLQREPSQVGTKSKTKGGRALSAYIGCIRHIHNLARREFNDPDLGLIRIPYTPFENYKVPKQPRSRHRDIDRIIIQKMIDQRRSLSGRVRLGVDVFLIGFSLLGMNTADLYVCEKSKKGVIHYFRSKTRDRRDDDAEMFVKIDPRIEPLMREYKDDLLMFDFHRRYTSREIFSANVNKGLARWSENNGVEKITFYASRHSFATLAYSARVDPAIITDCLNHIDESRRTDNIYIKKDWSVLWEANDKVLSLFDWSCL